MDSAIFQDQNHAYLYGVRTERFLYSLVVKQTQTTRQYTEQGPLYIFITGKMEMFQKRDFLPPPFPKFDDSIHRTRYCIPLTKAPLTMMIDHPAEQRGERIFYLFWYARTHARRAKREAEYVKQHDMQQRRKQTRRLDSQLKRRKTAQKRVHGTLGRNSFLVEMLIFQQRKMDTDCDLSTGLFLLLLIPPWILQA